MIKNIAFLLLLVALVGSKPQEDMDNSPVIVPGGIFAGRYLYPRKSRDDDDTMAHLEDKINQLEHQMKQIQSQAELQAEQIQNQVELQIEQLENQFGHQMEPMGNQFGHQMGQMGNQFGHQMGQMGNQFGYQMKQMGMKLPVMGRPSPMLQGKGGTTIINYNGKTVLIRNKVTTECKGKVTIRDNEVKCNGKRVPATKDICRPGKPMIRSKNTICIFENPKIRSTSLHISNHGKNIAVNGHDVNHCESGEVFTEQSLKKRCGDNVLTEKYAQVTYVPNFNEYGHIEMPNDNPYLGCKNPHVTVCEFGVDITGLRPYNGPFFIPFQN